MPDGALCLVDGIGDDEEMGQPAHELLHVIAQRLEKIGSNCDPDSFLLQEVLKALEVSQIFVKHKTRKISTTNTKEFFSFLFCISRTYASVVSPAKSQKLLVQW